MKIFNNKTVLFGAIGAFGLLLSCRDESKIIYDPQTYQVGSYARIIVAPPTEVINDGAGNFDAQSYPFTAEIANRDVAGVNKYDIQAELTDGNGKVLKARKLVGSITSWAMEASTQRPRGSTTVTGAQITSALGLTAADKAAGNIINFHETLFLTDGQVLSESNFDPNLTGPAYNSPFFHSVAIVALSSYTPVATLTWAKGTRLNGGSKDSLKIAFDRDITTAPSVALKANAALTPNSGSFGSVTAVTGSKSKFFAIYTAPAGGNGTAVATVSGGTSKANPLSATLTQAAALDSIDVDNRIPLLLGVTSDIDFIGKKAGQVATITATFDEVMGTAPTITITGQNMDPVTNAKMTLSKDKMSATYGYQFVDSDGNATSGALSITVTGAKDVAGNAAASSGALTSVLQTDLVTPTLLVVTLASPYDYIDKFRVASVNFTTTGSTEGTVFFAAVPTGATAPTIDNFSAANSFDVSDEYVPFTDNGSFDLYFYVESSTGNKSAITSTPVALVMH